jgi:Bacteriocin-protection, YdeI or OmpD-Associated
MPPSHRRFHLLGIFGYRNPESRARRIAKAMEEMVAYAEKAAAKRRIRYE